MRKALLVAICSLAACSTNPPPPANMPSPPVQLASGASTSSDPTPVHGVTPGHKCTEQRAQSFIGQRASDKTGNAILKASNAAVLRWSPPNTMLTMDYREDRVTIWIDASKTITKIRCG